MSDRIYLRRGNKADIPALSTGEPGWCVDEKELFIGNGADRVLVGYESLPNEYALSGKDTTGVPHQIAKIGTNDRTIIGNSELLTTFRSNNNPTVVLADLNEHTLWHTGNAPSSLAANGYQKFPNGLILQWGSMAVPPGGASLTFPVAFVSALYDVRGSADSGTPTKVSTLNTNNSGTGIIHDNAATVTIRWQAIGK